MNKKQLGADVEGLIASMILLWAFGSVVVCGRLYEMTHDVGRAIVAGLVWPATVLAIVVEYSMRSMR